MKALDHKRIEAIRIEKRNLEVEVANALNGYFRQHYKYDIQRIVSHLLSEILSVERGALDRFLLRKQGGFLMFQQGVKPSSYGLNEFRQRETWWTLENCSDMIRLFGECTEENKDREKKVNPAFEDLYQSHLKEKDGLRPLPIYLKKGDKDDGGYGPDMYHRDRSEPPTLDQLEAAMREPENEKWGRLMVHMDDIIWPSWKDRWIQFVKLPRQAQLEVLARTKRSEKLAKEQESQRPPYTRIGSIVRGVDKFKFEPKSVIAAIDRTFGLRPEGADISGTTTDSIYALRWAGGVARVSPEVLGAIQLLPLVTMVPQGHHTIVECAWPLTRHKQKNGSTYLDYHVGYYTTLAPTNAGAAARGLIEGVLGQFDQPGTNEHILVWGRGAGEQGVLMEEEEEIAEFKKIAHVRSAYAFCVAGGLHDFAEALNIMQTYSPKTLGRKLEQLKQANPDVGLSELERKFREMLPGRS